MKSLLKYMTLIAIVSLMAGCASGVKRLDGADNKKLSNTTVKQVQITLTENAKKLLPDNANFNVVGLKTAIENQLTAQSLLKLDSDQVLDVTISSFRSRSAIAAIMFGVMSGSDNIMGTVAIKDGTGKTLKEAEISASFALGGAAGGTDTRMGWLYEEFAKHAAAELTGTAAK